MNTNYILTEEETAKVEREVEHVTEIITTYPHEAVNKTEEN